MALLVHHEDGKELDSCGEPYDYTDRVFHGARNLHPRFRGARRYTIEEEVGEDRAAFGPYRLGRARGHHTGLRVWVEGPNYDEVWALYLAMGHAATRERYRVKPPEAVKVVRRRRRPLRPTVRMRAPARLRARPVAVRTDRLVTVPLVVAPGAGSVVDAGNGAHDGKGNGSSPNGRVKGLALVAKAARPAQVPTASPTAEPAPATSTAVVAPSAATVQPKNGRQVVGQPTSGLSRRAAARARRRDRSDPHTNRTRRGFGWSTA